MTSVDNNLQADNKSNTHCPRCGYDLRGAIETWKRECPISGVCAECGLSFEWADLLSTWRVLPRWNVEFPKRIMHFPINVPRTLICSFWPWKFFSSLKMHHEFHPLRITGYLLVLIGLLYVIFVARMGYDAWSNYSFIKKNPGNTMNVSREHVLAQAIFMPLSQQSPGMVTFPGTTSQVQWIFYQGKMTQITTRGVRKFNQPLESPFELLERRYRFYSNLTFWEVCPELMLFRKSGTTWRIHWKILLGFLLLGAVFSGLCPLGFVLLPESRRAAKIRREHLIRISMYSLAFLLVIMTWIMISLAFGREFDLNYSVLNMRVGIVCLFILPLVQLVWWSVATGKYLKIPHAWGVGASVVVIAYLLGPVLLMCVLIFLATVFT